MDVSLEDVGIPPDIRQRQCRRERERPEAQRNRLRRTVSGGIPLSLQNRWLAKHSGQARGQYRPYELELGPHPTRTQMAVPPRLVDER